MVQADKGAEEKSDWRPRNVVEAVASAIWFADYGIPFADGDEEQQQQYCILANAAIFALDLYRRNADRTDEQSGKESA